MMSEVILDCPAFPNLPLLAMDFLLAVCLLSIPCIFIFEHLHKRRVRARSRPPGPKGWPLVGNILDIPLEYSWVTFASMAKRYGDIMYLEALGQPMLILSSVQRCKDILDKRSASSRPPSTMYLDLTGMSWNLGLIPYGEGWRRRRLIVQQYFHIKSIDKHYAVQIVATRRMLKDILDKPSRFFDHVRKQTGTIILKTSYGYDVEGDDDPLVKIAEDGLEAFNEVSKQMFYAVDVLPILRYIPAWFPGAEFRRRAKRGKVALDLMTNKPFDDVKKQLASNVARASLATEYLKERERLGDYTQDRETIIRDAAGVAYGAGSDTTVSAILTFILAMSLYPEIQKRAQAELDLIVGPNKLPTFDHKEDLPYIKCILWETMRWQPVTPMGVPHASDIDDFYDGYQIPSGTIIQANVWALLHDEKMYPDPERFNPDRFMKEPGAGQEMPLDPTSVAFGFGRRICPGRHLALNTIWIAIASILSAFTIEKALDENGKEIVPEIAYTPGIISYPRPFSCRFVTRFDEVIDVIQK